MTLRDIIELELIKICDMESKGDKVGWRRRREAMQNFIANHIVTEKTYMSVVDSKFLQSDSLDLIKEKLCEKMSEDLTTYTKYDIMKSKITAEMVVFKKGVDK